MATSSKDVMLGATAPPFTLPGVDGKKYAFAELAQGKTAVVVMFICNHCPYVKAYFDRLIALAREYQPQGVAFVGINANDEKNYPEDSFAHMVTLAQKKEFPFPYVRDAQQTVARAYDAACTPEIYVADAHGIIRYHGAIDDNWETPARVTKRYLKNAIADLVAGRAVKEAAPHAIGCSIKWS